MKRLLLALLITGLMLCGCGNAEEESQKTNETVATETQEAEAETTEKAETTKKSEEAKKGATIRPLPDKTMNNLSNAILSVSFNQGDVYLDDTGKLQMKVSIYSYDKYDIVDISAMKTGDTIITNESNIKITSLEKSNSGYLIINGGLEKNGIELTSDDSGIYYQIEYNDSKCWHKVGTATLPVSADFEGIDSSDLDNGTTMIYPGDFLIEGVVYYDFSPLNTTVRVEGGQVVALERVYTP